MARLIQLNSSKALSFDHPFFTKRIVNLGFFHKKVGRTCNVSQVQDGDILVSDTYYSTNELKLILEKIGLNKKVEIFASNAGKASGKIWPIIKEKYDIISHFGDNQTSDIQSPQQHGIKTQWFNSNYSDLEKTVYQRGHLGLANLMRTLRLLNPYPIDSVNYKIWQEQAQFNVPILIQTSFYLDSFCKNNNKNNLLFTARDCCHLIKIFSYFFPEYKSTYFYTSRHAFKNASPEFCKYVSSLYNENSIIVDGLGTGRSCYNFFTTKLHISPCIVAINGIKANPDINIHFIGYQTEPYIESINLANHGKCMDYDANGLKLFPIEYNAAITEPAYKCIETCLILLNKFEFKGFDNSLTQHIFSALYQTQPIGMPYLSL